MEVIGRCVLLRMPLPFVAYFKSDMLLLVVMPLFIAVEGDIGPPVVDGLSFGSTVTLVNKGVVGRLLFLFSFWLLL